MKPHHVDRVLALIDDFQLHTIEAGIPRPVTLEPLSVLFRPHASYALGDAFGMCAFPIGREITARTPGHVLLNADLEANSARIVFGHEIGHLLMGHEGSEPCFSVDPWFHGWQEREAWEVCAMLVVPPAIVWARGTLAEAADHFQVSYELAAIALRLWKSI